MIVSKNLRAALRYEGYSKVASTLMKNQHEYINELDGVSDAIKSISVKVAVNRENEKIILDGINSFRRAQEL